MTPWLIFFGFILVALCATLVGLFLKAFYDKAFIKALVLKGLASICFVALGAISCFSGQLSPTRLLIFIGLCFGIVGDEVIALCQVDPSRDTLWFIGGGSFFLVGHVFYVISLFSLGNPSWIALAISYVAMICLGLAYNKRRKFLCGEMKIPLGLYLAAVTFVGALAIGCFVGRLTLGTALFAIGGVLFTLSDNTLFAYKLGEEPRFSQNIILHVTYYVAQILFAWSICCL